MGRLHKRFNAKARQQPSEASPLKTEGKLKLQQDNVVVDGDYQSNYDESNPLVVVKVKKKIAKPVSSSKVKFISKRRRKELERVIEVKKKKAKRAEVLQSLAEHQVTAEELALYSSMADLGNTSLKRKQAQKSECEDVSSVSKRRRRRRTKTAFAGKNNAGAQSTSIYMESVSSSDDSSQSGDLENSGSETKTARSPPAVVAESEDKTEEKNSVMIKSTSYYPDGEQMQHCEEFKTDRSKISQEEDELNHSKLPSASCATSDVCAVDCKIQAACEKSKKPVFVEVKRSNDIQEARLLLPILPEEHLVMECIQENDVVVICGETGSGKTTQVPQFLYEAGYGSASCPGVVGITEPRRVAALSMSKRVGEEMSLDSSVVSYQIRYEGNVTDQTVIKFMTDGVLLKEMETDFLLSKYSAIIIDEAHERSVFTDILVGLLSRAVPLRRKQGKVLKLIIMSATLRIEDFTENMKLFARPPPVLKVESRQYPVTVHFNKRTHDDYVTEAYKKVCKIHRTLKPEGGILVFLTGQSEVLALCRKLRKSFPLRKFKKHEEKRLTSRAQKVGEAKLRDSDDQAKLPRVDLDSYSSRPGLDAEPYAEVEDDEDLDLAYRNNDLVSDSDGESSGMDDSAYTPAADAALPLYVLPLYSLLSSAKQAKVFADPPPGTRLCVVATNVAETSLTIPGIKFIVDSGKVKKKFYDKTTGVSTFRITWTSKASANQRAGRAGRVGPGHCYRLYSSAVFQNDFEDFAEAEICRRPVEDLVLQMKSMHIDKVINFPFPTPPDSVALKAAEDLLLDLGALKTKKTVQGGELCVISPLGKLLSRFPISPRFAKMLYLASQREGCLQYMIAIVAALTVREIFTDDIDLSDHAEIEEPDFKAKRALVTQARRKWAGEGPTSALGDLMVILRAVGACEYAGCNEQFCLDNGLRYKAMVEIRKLRAQLTNAVNTVIEDAQTFVDPKMSPPSVDVARHIGQVVLSCFGDRVARKLPADEAKALKIKNAYKSCSTDDLVYIHPTSALFTKLPEWVVYQEIMETSKPYMKTLFSIESEWLAVHAAYKCTFSRPLELPAPCYGESEGSVKCYMTCSYGPHGWPLPAQLLDHPDSPDKYRLFAKFFLEAKVCPKLDEFVKSLLSPPSIMCKSWAHLQARTEGILCALLEKQVCTRNKLLSVWASDPTYCLKEYMMWLPESLHESVTAIWPPR